MLPRNDIELIEALVDDSKDKIRYGTDHDNRTVLMNLILCVDALLREVRELKK
jgi:hypothetical protein